MMGNICPKNKQTKIVNLLGLGVILARSGLILAVETGVFLKILAVPKNVWEKYNEYVYECFQPS
jgi:hypothetical protein